jgi:hypothetical protein
MSKAFLWDNLLEYIDGQSVIPILGPELLVSRIDGRDVMVHRYVAERLAEEFGIASNDLPEDDTLNFVVCRFLDDPKNRREEIYPAINRIIKASALALTVPEPLRKLARIRHFKLFITTTFDSLLEQALAQERPKDVSPTRVLTYSPNDPQDLERDWRETQSQVVYHLLGKVSPSADYVITEEDTLEYFYGMQKERPEILFDALKESHLLIIGSSFPDWLARFFIRIAKGDRLPSDERKRFEIVVDRRVYGQREDKNLVLFLDLFSYGTKIFAEGGAIEFVNELSERYQKRHPPGEAAVPLPAVAPKAGVAQESPLIFLSYASEDLEAVKKIRDELAQLGWDVWFDKRKLEGGDHFGLEIEEGIKACALFLPIISANTQRRTEGYFRDEWLIAAKRLRRISDKATWAIPIAIDETPEKEADIPEIFVKLELQWVRLPSGKPTPEFTKRMTDLFRDERKRQRGMK